MASKAFFDVVELLSTNTPDEEGSGGGETGLAELLAAMAGGWNSQCIVEILPVDKPSTSTATVALSAAAVRTGGRHIRTFQSEEVTIEGMDFAVVDFERRDAGKVLREARVGPRGAVLVSKNGRRCGGDLTSNSAGEWWGGVLMQGIRVVRSAYLPIGNGGVEIVHVGVGEGKSLPDRKKKIQSRWIKHVDRVTGVEHVFRR